MKLTFGVDRKDRFLTIEGDILEWSMNGAAAKSLTELHLKIEVISHKVHKDVSRTPVIQLPNLLGDGWIRVRGATKYDLQSKFFSKKGSLTVTFHVCGFYSSYETACAAEMKTIMEKK